MEGRRSRKEPIITLVVLLIIAAVIVSWLTGLWSCENGRKVLTDQERLTIADYINSSSVLIQHSNKTAMNFDLLLSKVKDISREELDQSLADIIEESKITLQNAQEINPPALFEVTHGYLNLVFNTRNKAYENFKPALFNALQDIDLDIASSQIANSFFYLLMSDEIFLYFQDELKRTGEKLEIPNLTIIDSQVFQDRDMINKTSVAQFITDIKNVTGLQERRGLAVISNSIEFEPRIVNEQGDFLILANGNTVNMTILIENQGNVTENDVLVTVVYSTESNPRADEKTYTINNINPSEQKAVTITGFSAYPGLRCSLKVEVAPVPGEVLLTNNVATYNFMVEK
jgi:hypothetical protein